MEIGLPPFGEETMKKLGTLRALFLAPPQVVEILNRYLTQIADCILGNGGTICISRAVADTLEGRIRATSLGDTVKLKGK